MSTFTVADIVATMRQALDVDVMEAHAGSSVTLWAEVDGYVVVVGREAGPWQPDGPAEVGEHFLVEVTRGGRDAYLAGTEPEYFLEVLPTLDALATGLSELSA